MRFVLIPVHLSFFRTFLSQCTEHGGRRLYYQVRLGFTVSLTELYPFRDYKKNASLLLRQPSEY